MTLRSPSRAKFWTRMLFLVLLSLAVYSIVAAVLGWRDVFSFVRPDRLRWLLVMGLVWTVAAVELRPTKRVVRKRSAKTATDGAVPPAQTQDGASPVNGDSTVRQPKTAASADGTFTRPAETLVDELPGEAQWMQAREMPHGFVPDPVDDHDYLSLVHAAATAGLAEAQAKLAEYASRRNAVVEAFYWMSRARRNGLEGADDFLCLCCEQWKGNDFPPEYENEYEFFDIRQGVLGRAALRLACGVEVERAQQRLAEMIASGDAEAKTILDEFGSPNGWGTSSKSIAEEKPRPGCLASTVDGPQMKPRTGLTAFCVASLSMSLLAAAPSADAPLNDGVNRSDPNFVTASLLVFGPGDELFSCVGHTCIRLECPHFKLDYCFSYESERAVERLPKFFAGKLKMGLFAIPTDEFLKEYVEVGRGLRQYKMNLPPAVKQRLWKIMDDKAAEGANLPYDYNKRGCAKSAYSCIRDALSLVQIERVPWTEDNAPTRREKFCELLKDTHPWNIFFLNAIVGTETDNVEEVVVPRDLLTCLRKIRVEGVPIISGDGVELLPTKVLNRPSFVTPMMVAWLLVGVAVGSFFKRVRLVDWFFVALQTLAGMFFTYLVSASGLPTSCWNWLIVPFNPLPLIFWRFRRYWAWPFAAVLLAWGAFMLLSPHQLTDPAYLVIVAAYVVFYAKIGLSRVDRAGSCRH